MVLSEFTCSKCVFRYLQYPLVLLAELTKYYIYIYIAANMLTRIINHNINNTQIRGDIYCYFYVIIYLVVCTNRFTIIKR